MGAKMRFQYMAERMAGRKAGSTRHLMVFLKLADKYGFYDR